MDKAKLTGSAAILLVKDVVYTVKWYTEKLGFSCSNLYGNPPSFAIVHRDNKYIMFAEAPPDKIIPNWKIRDKTSNVYFWVDDVESLYNEFKSSGATIDYELCIQPYGVKEFGINDPDGYDIAFGQVLK
jgi:uncharacterized glyoxalase superfamily protein PhnB